MSTTEEKRLKVAVSGLGRIAWQYHIPAIQADSRFHLTAVADPLAERIEEAAETFGIQGLYPSVTEMLQQEELDLLVIASPTGFHVSQAIEAFQHGVDVICEKPLAGNLADAEKIVAAMKESGQKMMVYQPHRLVSEAVALKGILDSGILGDLFMVRRSWNRFSRRNDWQAFLANGGGMLNNYGSHFLDQFISLFGGNFSSFDASLRRVVSSGDAEDFVKIMAVNGQNITVDLEINMGAAIAQREWLVYGTTGTAVLEDKQWKVKYYDPATLPPLPAQNGLAAEGRSYSSGDSIDWQEKIIPCDTAECPKFYDYCYRYFALNEAPLVPIEDTMEVMQLLDSCRNK